MKTRLLFLNSLLFFFLTTSFYGLSQSVQDTTIYIIVDQNPTFQGSTKALLHYIYTNIKYPDSALQNNIKGKVYLKMVVEPDGTLSNIHVIKGIGYGCDNEALRLVSNMPKWEAGMIKGRKVRVYSNLSISFKPKNKPVDPIYSKVDSLPGFAVGFLGISGYIQNTLMYPVDIIQNKIIDTVNIKFVVGKDNKISHVRLLEQKDTLNAYDYEAIRVIKNLPVSEPAILNNQPVNVQLFIPVVFDYHNIDTAGAERELHVYNNKKFYYYSIKEYAVVEDMPSFPKGRDAMMEYLAHNIHYPAEAKQKFQSGTVYLQFVVGTDGTIGNVKVLKGVSESLDKEAVRVIRNMPKWIPGKQHGHPVRVKYNFPIKFTLEVENQNNTKRKSQSKKRKKYN